MRLVVALSCAALLLASSSSSTKSIVGGDVGVAFASAADPNDSIDHKTIDGFGSRLAVNMVVSGKYSEFDATKFKYRLLNTKVNGDGRDYLSGVIAGESLNSDSALYTFAKSGTTSTLPSPTYPQLSFAPDSTVSSERESLRQSLLDTFTLLEVCPYDISAANAALNSSDDAFGQWPRHLCSKTQKDANAKANYGGVLVRFTFSGLDMRTSYAERLREDAVQIGGLVIAYYPPNWSSDLLFDRDIAEEDHRQFLSDALNWTSLIGQTVPYRQRRVGHPVYPSDISDGMMPGGGGGKSPTASPATALPILVPISTADDASFASAIAFRPDFGGMSGRPLATIGRWGQFADRDDYDHETVSIIEIASNNKGLAAFAVVLILAVIGACVLCCIYFLYCVPRNRRRRAIAEANFAAAHVAAVGQQAQTAGGGGGFSSLGDVELGMGGGGGRNGGESSANKYAVTGSVVADANNTANNDDNYGRPMAIITSAALQQQQQQQHPTAIPITTTMTGNGNTDSSVALNRFGGGSLMSVGSGGGAQAPPLYSTRENADGYNGY